MTRRNEPSTHHAEVFIQDGFVSTDGDGWGWQCLTCGVEETGLPEHDVARSRADVHETANAALPGEAAMTILLRRCHVGWLAMWWEPNRSAPYDCKWGFTPGAAVDRLDFPSDPEVVEALRDAA